MYSTARESASPASPRRKQCSERAVHRVGLRGQGVEPEPDEVAAYVDDDAVAAQARLDGRRVAEAHGDVATAIVGCGDVTAGGACAVDERVRQRQAAGTDRVE